MLSPFVWLSILLGVGVLAGAACAFTGALERFEPGRLSRLYLAGVTTLLALRVGAYVAANVFGVQGVRPWSGGPRDPTNLLLGALLGMAAVPRSRNRLGAFLREPDVLLALRLAAGVAFVLAGLVNVFLKDLGVDFFVQAGYTRTFRLFILTIEVLGGVALLVPWRWLTLAVAAGLAIDMLGAIETQLRLGESAAGLAPALAMLLRLALLVAVALLGVRRRWWLIALGAIGCALAAVVGARLL